MDCFVELIDYRLGVGSEAYSTLGSADQSDDAGPDVVGTDTQCSRPQRALSLGDGAECNVGQLAQTAAVVVDVAVAVVGQSEIAIHT